MATKVSDFMLSRLREWGVERVFAYPGDAINGLLAAWGRADNDPVFVHGTRRWPPSRRFRPIPGS